MHQGERLKWLIDNSGKSRQELALLSGISEASIYNYQKEDVINSKKLKKLSEALGVPMSEFEDLPVVNDGAAAFSRLQEKIKSLEQMIKDKEVIILKQSEIIELLKHQNQKHK